MKVIPISILFLLQSFFSEARQHTVQRPRLVVGIVVDQMRWDYLYRYYDRYSENGFKRLLNRGFAAQNTYLDYVPSYTAPGHATIYSGALPAIHGIVGNDWIDAATGESRYCAQDDAVGPVGGSVSAGKMSPRQMRSNTIGDELRLATNFRSRVFGVALKDRGAVFPAGHLANGAFWLDDSSGNFMSSSYYAPELPAWLTRFNQQRWTDTVLSLPWTTLYPITTYQQSIADNNDYESLKPGESAPVFPHLSRPGEYKQIRSFPGGNTLTFMLAKKLIAGEGLGKNTVPDMLTISLSSTDYIGHAYAPNAVEVEDLYLRLDREIANFLRYLDAAVGKGRYVLFMTADHGGAHNARFLQDKKVPAGILSEYDLKRTLNDRAKAVYGQDSLIRAVMNYQVVFNERLIQKLGIHRDTFKQFIMTFCSQYQGMAQVIDLDHIYAASMPHFLKDAVQNGYYAKRCGSVGLLYEPAWYSDGPKGTTHGTWNPYDTHIPLLWYGWHIPKGATFRETKVTSIAATLAALLQIQVPNGSSGTVISPIVR